jgi:hypothetical protein
MFPKGRARQNHLLAGKPVFDGCRLSGVLLTL